jgi:Leucine-rich repeat (LRR) protein
MHLCTAIAGQIETLQHLQTRIADCVLDMANGKTSKADVTNVQAEFIACKEALHELRLNTPEYLRKVLGIKSGEEPGQWDYEISIIGIHGPRWRKNAEGYMQTIDFRSCTSIPNTKALKGLEELEELYLGGCTGLTDVTAIGTLARLQTLYLGGCTGLTDVTAIGTLARLQTLYLSGCTGLTDVTALEALTELEELYLGGCTGLALEKIDVLRLKLPNCTIKT